MLKERLVYNIVSLSLLILYFLPFSFFLCQSVLLSFSILLYCLTRYSSLVRQETKKEKKLSVKNLCMTRVIFVAQVDGHSAHEASVHVRAHLREIATRHYSGVARARYTY